MKSLGIALVVSVLACAPAEAAPKPPRRGRPSARRSSTLSLRRRLNLRSPVSLGGSYTVDFTQGFSSDGALWTPTNLAFRPDGGHLLWGRTEYSVNFDSYDSFTTDGHRVTHGSDHISMLATTDLPGKLGLAIAPQFGYLPRGAGGFRYGATLLGQWKQGRNTYGSSLTWAGATSPGDNNPSGLWDAAVGYGRVFGKFTAHLNLTAERPTGGPAYGIALTGLEWRVSKRVALDFSAQQVGIGNGKVDHQGLVNFSWSWPSR
ncbi:MAG: hypothetical protein U0Q16_14735 [Bryobacteraceae bacterium]